MRVPSHVGTWGNQCADRLAKRTIVKQNIDTMDGGTWRLNIWKMEQEDGGGGRRSIRFSTTGLREFGREGQSSSQLEPVDGGSATLWIQTANPKKTVTESGSAWTITVSMQPCCARQTTILKAFKFVVSRSVLNEHRRQTFN